MFFCKFVFFFLYNIYKQKERKKWNKAINLHCVKSVLLFLKTKKKESARYIDTVNIFVYQFFSRYILLRFIKRFNCTLVF